MSKKLVEEHDSIIASNYVKLEEKHWDLILCSQGTDGLSCEISVTNPNSFNENSIYGKTGLSVEVMFSVIHKPS